MFRPWSCVHHVASILALNLALCTASLTAADELPSANPADVGLSAERLARLDAAMQDEVDAGRKAGIVTLIARHGRVAHLRAHGFAEIETRTAMRTDSMFRLYSMTKPITSVALLMLYEEGKFQLGDPLEKYIPAFKDVKVFAGMQGETMRLEEPRRKPTIHDVFRHTAGFSYGNGTSPVDRAYQQSGIGLDAVATLEVLVTEKLPKVPLLYHPGEQWVYSVSHDVQAYLVEYFSGMSFDAFCRERIFEPLGMRNTVFGVPQQYVSRYTARYGRTASANSAAGLALLENRDGRLASGAPAGGVGPYARFTNLPFGGHGLSSTAMDYALFAQMLLNGGDLNGTRILGEKTVQLMTTNQLPPNFAGPFFFPPGATGMGLGVWVLRDPALNGNLDSEGAFGWAGGGTTWASVDPKENLVLLMMAQHTPTDDHLFGRFRTLAYQAIVD
jgi:CubicO group peptidase (beta-lactamase class C family)